MVLHFLGALLAIVLLATEAPASTTPQAQVAGETVFIPFDPPLGEKVRYRWEQTEQEDGKLEMSWSVDDYRFEETKDGYRVTVTPVSSGSNENDPRIREFMKKLEELTSLPFVLRLNDDVEIVELERADEYWSKIMQALHDGLSKMEPKRPGHDKMVEAVVGMFANMPADARLAKLTEPAQPLFEFAATETSIGQPILGSVESISPFGPLKQEMAVTLTRVRDGIAHLTLRSTVPTAELKKLTAAMFDRLNNGALKPEEVAKMKAELAAAKDFNSETVADYKVGVEDGMLESFHSTQTVTMSEGGKLERTIKTVSVKRLD